MRKVMRDGDGVRIPSSGASSRHAYAMGGVVWTPPYWECRSYNGAVRLSGASGLLVRVPLLRKEGGWTVSVARERRGESSPKWLHEIDRVTHELMSRK
jgi:hypothetical protein